MKAISIEEVNVLVEYMIKDKGRLGEGRVLDEAHFKVCIQTDDDCIMTRYVISDLDFIDQMSLDGLVEDEYPAIPIAKDREITAKDIREWIDGRAREDGESQTYDQLLMGSDLTEHVCAVVALLAKHGMWKWYYYELVTKALKNEKTEYTEKEAFVYDEVAEILDKHEMNGLYEIVNVELEDGCVNVTLRVDGIDAVTIAAIGKTFGDDEPTVYSLLGGYTQLIFRNEVFDNLKE